MSERVESEGFYEMLWDCDHCGTKGLLGKSQRHCAECGAPQNPIKRYFPSPEQQKKIEGHSYEGADRHCPACKAPMAAKAKNCTQCGSPLDGSKEVGGIAKPVVVNKRRRIWPYILVAFLLLAIAIWWFFIRKHDATMTVTGHRWARVIAIEEFRETSESAWRNEVPADASLPICTRRQRTTKQVADGEDCHTERVDKKDGTFEQVKKCKTKYRSEGIDDDWCTYRVNRWIKVDEAKTSGTGTNATWPALSPPAGRRAGPRTETLTLDFGNQSCQLGDAAWRKYQDGQKVKLEVRARSGDIVCGSL